MATYRAIAATETDPEAPVTSALMKALDGNATAIAEDDATAPKIKRKSIASGAAATTQTFTGLGAYSGISFAFFAENNGASTRQPTIEYSTNGGSTWSTAENLTGTAIPAGVLMFCAEGHLDFATGTMQAVGVGSSANYITRVSATMAGASLAIDAVRFSMPAESCVVMIRPNGGTV